MQLAEAFLESESLAPFVDVFKKQYKGIFVLVKTSNTSSGEIKDVVTVYDMLPYTTLQ